MDPILTTENLNELFSYLSETLVEADPQIGQIICCCSDPSTNAAPLQLTEMFGETHGLAAGLIEFVVFHDCFCDCDVLKLSQGAIGSACSTLWLLGLLENLFSQLHDSKSRGCFKVPSETSLAGVLETIQKEIKRWENVSAWID